MALLPSLLRRERSLPTIGRIFDEYLNDPFFSMSNRDISGRLWPDMDIIEEKDTFLIRADIPGVEKKDIDISVSGDVLTVSGEKKEESRADEGMYNHLERNYGSFCRSFTLPDYVDKENIDATFQNGVLQLSMKKTGQPQTQSRRIEVKG